MLIGDKFIIILSMMLEHDSLSPQTRQFANPICKQTYESLPRIYGGKKRAKRSVHRVKEIKKQQIVAQKAPQDIPGASRKGLSSRTRTHSGILKLSKPKVSCDCWKRNCICHLRSEKNEEGNKTKRKQTLSVCDISLPQIKRFELEDLESQHKVLVQQQRTAGTVKRSGLQKIIEQWQGAASSKSRAPRFRSKDGRVSGKQRRCVRSIGTNQVQSGQEEQIENIRKTRKNDEITTKSPRYATQVDDSDTPNSKDSISVSSFVFKRAKKLNTNFHQLKDNEVHDGQKKRQKNPSTLSNGLFRIPQEPQYCDYLQNYQPLHSEFTMKDLIKRPTFRIIKSPKGVFFGEANHEQQRHGVGVSVSEQEIYEGLYQENSKISGYERNIDGLYIGGYENGLRTGFGTFRWNNGQVYEGNWEKGMKNGKGIWKSPKGYSYEGEWRDNRQNGKGIYKHKMSTYIGEFKNFLKSGQGEENFVNGDRYVGEYSMGKPHGKGRYEWRQGSYYEGEFKNGLRQGQGKWVDDQGTTYIGLFKHDLKHGFGRQEYSSGERFEGQFIEGAISTGKLYDINSRCIEVKRK